MNSKTLKQNEAAEYLGLSLNKFRQLEDEDVFKRLKGSGAWYSVEDLDAWLKGGSDENSNE